MRRHICRDHVSFRKPANYLVGNEQGCIAHKEHHNLKYEHIIEYQTVEHNYTKGHTCFGGVIIHGVEFIRH